MNRVLAAIEAGKRTARLVCGGNRVTRDGLGRGYFVEPTIFADCADDIALVTDEIFGPVMSVLKFSTEDEVVRRANATPYGLAAGVFTRDLTRAHRVVAALQAGVCWINNYNITPVEIPVRRHEAVGDRPRERPRHARALHAAEERLRRDGRRRVPVLRLRLTLSARHEPRGDRPAGPLQCRSDAARPRHRAARRAVCSPSPTRPRSARSTRRGRPASASSTPRRSTATGSPNGGWARRSPPARGIRSCSRPRSAGCCGR